MAETSDPSDQFRRAIDRVCEGESLAFDEMRELMAAVVQGAVSDPLLTGLLVALKAKGETTEEIGGAARALRDAVRGDLSFPDVADSCGTGGDGAKTVNISTAAAVVAAVAGVRVAKHGNRSVSSKSGSADVLEACGVAIDAPPTVARRCLESLSICFLFAPQYHQGVRHAMPVRQALGVRTLFNLLGPLVNPAAPRFQLVGVYDPRLCATLARTLGMLGCERALVVHGSGLDEIALHDVTHAALLEGGSVRELTLSPEEAGLERAPLSALRGGSAAENGDWLRGLLAGGGSKPHQDAVALNAGALIWICGKAGSLAEGTRQAQAVLSAGRGAEILTRWAALSHAEPATRRVRSVGKG